MEINKKDIEKEREIIKSLQQQLAEKDKEIEFWQQQASSNCAGLTDEMYRMILKSMKKQVCDEIREKAEAFGNGVTGQLGYIVTLLLLDKIEK